MSANVHPGFVFRPNAEGAHVWVVISNPAPNDGKVLVVSWTTLREYSADHACYLEPGDHPAITWKSTIAYTRARVWDPEKIVSAVEGKALRRLDDLKPQTLQKIRNGALASHELRSEWKRML